MNKHTKTLWQHNRPDEPVIYYLRYDENDEEIHRIEIYSSGKKRYGDKERQHPNSDVWIYGITCDEVMNSNIENELISDDISPSEFDALWCVPDNPYFIGNL